MSTKTISDSASHAIDFSQYEQSLEDVIHSLKCINHHAGYFSQMLSKIPVSEQDTIRKQIYQSKLNALYGIKGYVLDKLVSFTSKIDIHLIGDNDYYCFYFTFGDTTHSFHRPKKNASINISQVDDTEVLHSFNKTSSKSYHEKELSEALRTIHGVFNIHINEFIDELYFTSSETEYFVGWEI